MNAKAAVTSGVTQPAAGTTVTAIVAGVLSWVLTEFVFKGQMPAAVAGAIPVAAAWVVHYLTTQLVKPPAPPAPPVVPAPPAPPAQ